MKINLSELAEMRQGYQFREKVNPEENGSIRIIQMKDIEKNKIDFQNAPLIKKIDIKNEYFLKKNDILFCARGENNYSLILHEDHPDSIPVSQFFIIRTDSQKLAPYYLLWYFHQNEASVYFKANRLTSTVSLINKKTLEEMPIPLLPLDKQILIGKTYQLSERAIELEEKLIKKKQTLIHQMLKKVITKEYS